MDAGLGLDSASAAAPSLAGAAVRSGAPPRPLRWRWCGAAAICWAAASSPCAGAAAATSSPALQAATYRRGGRSPAPELAPGRGALWPDAGPAAEPPKASCEDQLSGNSPWLALKCWRGSYSGARPGLNLLSLAIGQEPSTNLWDLHFNVGQVLGVVLFCTGVVFACVSLKDVHRFVMLLAKSSLEQSQQQHRHEVTLVPEKEASHEQAGENYKEVDALGAESKEAGSMQWSVLSIIGLTSYRFYTGFLSATWLPYLLAMEGQDLWLEKQSMFMGIAKLIYGGTILMNPVFGLIGDQAVALSHGVGRRLFVRVGVTVAAIGIYICTLAAREHTFLSFLSGILVWRLGEAMNDVTTEALVPEMVPQEQYQLASGIKASSFLLGGLFGYVLLIVFADVNYRWLYYAYPIGMFTCAVPSLYLLDKDHPFAPSQQGQRPQEQSSESFHQSLIKAYVDPIRYRGGFPRACLAVFIFSLGTAPMFFLLLIVRDLVGIQDAVRAQQHFSAGSICFFLSAAVASVVIATVHPREPPPEQEEEQAEQRHHEAVRNWADAKVLENRGRMLTWSMIVFGVIVLLIPMLAGFQQPESRDRAYYMLTVFFGGAFGISFSLFQDLTWQILPPEVNFANAMGFNVMSRLLGVGLGNFFCGVILDMSYGGDNTVYTVYAPRGYIIMCTFSGLAVLTSTAVAKSAITSAMNVDAEEHASSVHSSSVPAA